jgi:hypothetical protein
LLRDNSGKAQSLTLDVRKENMTPVIKCCISLLSFGILVHTQAEFVYQVDHDIVGFGERDEMIFSTGN